MKNYFRLLWNHPTPIRFVTARLLMVTGGCRWWTIRQDGFRLRFVPSNAAMSLWMNPGVRKGDHAFFRAWSKAGDWCVDVGANIGEVALALAVAVGPKGRVMAVEPHPRTCGWLRENIALNGLEHVTVVQVGVGEKAGVMRLTDSRRDDMNHVTDGEGVDVEVKRLDELVKEWNQLDLLKVDVEGYELPVLRGGAAVMSRVRCVVVEICQDNFRRFGYETGDLLEWIRGSGFSLFRSLEPGRLKSVPIDYLPQGFENVIGVRDVAELKARTGWEVVG
ncbi:MAG: FkbM family methyltransferase [Verrucomicrobiia bacterium]